MPAWLPEADPDAPAVRAAEPSTTSSKERPTRSTLSLQLLDKSLVRLVELEEGESRLVMLETIREYAAERLDASPEVCGVPSVCGRLSYSLGSSEPGACSRSERRVPFSR